VLEVCVTHELIADNPASGIKFKAARAATADREPFSGSDLKAIFKESSVYASGAPPRGSAGEAGYWIPLIALYTGMRLQEIGQLRLADIGESDGIRFFNVDTFHEGQSLKTASSYRKVPIPEAILKLGFLDYVAKMARLRHQHLFPLLNHQRPVCTAAFSKWINRYLRTKCGISDSRKVFHSFRHTFKDACRDAGLTEEIHNRLTGHAARSVADRYGTGHSLATLKAAIDRVSYPALN